MKHTLLVKGKNYSLVTKLNDYIVVFKYDDHTQSWAQGHYFTHWENPEEKANDLKKSVDFLREKEPTINNKFVTMVESAGFREAYAIANATTVETEIIRGNKCLVFRCNGSCDGATYDYTAKQWIN